MIELIESVMNQGIAGAVPISAASDKKQTAKTDFGDMLKAALDGLNDTQKASDQKTLSLAAGKQIDLHDVMIEAQKASIMLETAVQVQKKAIDAYTEMMRMQV